MHIEENPKGGECWTPTPYGGDVVDPLEIRPSPCATVPNLVVLGKTVRVLWRKSAWRIWPIAARLSRSSGQTWIDWLPVTSY